MVIPLAGELDRMELLMGRVINQVCQKLFFGNKLLQVGGYQQRIARIVRQQYPSGIS